mgnify:CR=1 FL=1
MKNLISQLLADAVDRLKADGVLPTDISPSIQVENARDKAHGDFASNLAMMLAKPAGMKPRDLAEKLIAALPAHQAVASVNIAGPGFINFFQDAGWLASQLEAALAAAGKDGMAPCYAGREEAASPATGLAKRHQAQQEALVTIALGLADGGAAKRALKKTEIAEKKV